MIDVTRLKAFIYAAESLNFTEAAIKMHLTQPTVSHHMKALEKALGVELFDRTGHALKLTEAGRLLLPYAHKLVHQVGEVQEMMVSLQQNVVGHLRIACSTTAGKYILPQLAARFASAFQASRSLSYPVLLNTLSRDCWKATRTWPLSAATISAATGLSARSSSVTSSP